MLLMRYLVLSGFFRLLIMVWFLKLFRLNVYVFVLVEGVSMLRVILVLSLDRFWIGSVVDSVLVEFCFVMYVR